MTTANIIDGRSIAETRDQSRENLVDQGFLAWEILGVMENAVQGDLHRIA
jgi:hypothetical protein